MDEKRANETHLLTCYQEFGGILSRGVWLSDDPLHYAVPSLLLQITLFSIMERFLYFILRPLGQPSVTAQMLGGVILGPTVLGRNTKFTNRFFPPKSLIVLDPFARFSFIIIQMLMGVKLDPSALKKTGKMPFAIGILGYCFPLFVGIIMRMLIGSVTEMDHEIDISISLVIRIQSMSTYPVITSFLSDLKMLNSELGRVASSSCMVSDFCSSIIMFSIQILNILQKKDPMPNMLGYTLSAILVVFFIVFIVRPAALWVNRRTPQGQPVKEIHTFGIVLALLVCSLASEVLGIGYALGPFIFGLALPDGPPLGATLDNRIGSLVTVLFIPMFFTSCGVKTDLFSVRTYQHVWITEIILVSCFMAKTISIMLLLLYYKTSFRDALTLALVMNSRGLVEVAIYDSFVGHKLMSHGIFSILVVSSLIQTFFVSNIVRNLYDPSRRYLPQRRRTIQHNGCNNEFGILACVHNQDNVPTIIRILEASNPTKLSPIHVCVLYLVKLTGRVASVLIAHNRHEIASSNTKNCQSEPIVKAFRYYEQKHDFVSVGSFTSISPSDSMHEDVCSLALENRSILIIMPFHKQWLAGGNIHSSAPVRNLNYNVLAKAPCSVGILVDRRSICSSGLSLQGVSMLNIATLFIGGFDDQEALSYGSRMVKQRNVKLTVFRFNSRGAARCYAKMRYMDNEIMNEFRSDNFYNDRVMYKEEEVSDGQGLVKAIRSIENAYDLVMVGRRHMECPLMAGLTEWTEFPELGIVGDILAASDLHVESDYQSMPSVMVVQQQARVWAENVVLDVNSIKS